MTKDKYKVICTKPNELCDFEYVGNHQECVTKSQFHEHNTDMFPIHTETEQKNINNF